jgi:hypothetical protein
LGGIVSMLAALFCLGISDAYANGDINFVSGKAQILDAGGDARAAAKGGRVVPGEVVVTGADGEVHLVMDDNGLIAVRPNSRLKIEKYVAKGDEKDSAVFVLLRGSLRSVTGWIGKLAPKNYAIRTPSATIGIRGTDHEVAVIDSGEEAGTYDKVNTGETVLKTTLGEIAIQPGRAGFAKKSGADKPALLAAIPAFYKPTPHEQLINQTKSRLELTTDQRLKLKQEDIRRQGGLDAQGNARISDSCTRDPSAANAFSEFVHAYELGNTALIRSKMDPSMLGYLHFIEGVVQDTNRFKQIQLTLKDMQIQCGPDVTVIQTAWEKRFLDVTTFTPGLFTGRATILMHRDNGGWKFAAVSGDNPFSSQSGSLAQLSFGPALSIAGLGAAPTQLALTIEVVDNDLAGKGSIQVQIVTNQGDAENVDLTEVSPGRFSRSSYFFAGGAAVPGDGVLQVGAGAVLTLRYVDQNPGNNRPAVLLTRSLATSGTPVAVSATTVSTAATTSSTSSTSTSSTTTAAGTTTTTAIGATTTTASGTTTTAAGTTTTAAGTTTTSSGTTTTAFTGTTTTSTVTTTTLSTTPSPFRFASVSKQALSSSVTSNGATITGNAAPAAVSIVGGSYSINGGPFTSGAGTISAGQTLTLMVTTASTPATSTTATVTVGGVSASFTATTVDTVPDPFSFSPATAQQPRTTATSSVTITGIDSSTPISITGGTYSINGGAFTSSAGTVTNGQSVTVAVAASGSQNTTTSATLNVGGVSGSFSVTTWNTTPNAFSLGTTTASHNIRTLTCTASSSVTITGITGPASISISGASVPAATYSINGGAATSSSGTITNGSSVTVTATAPYSRALTTTPQPEATLSVGGVSSTFSIICQ